MEFISLSFASVLQTTLITSSQLAYLLAQLVRAMHRYKLQSSGFESLQA